MWNRDTAIYQIDPSLFLDGDGDGRGDLPGVERALEYVKWLGASTLWLLPFYRSPFRDHGYDVTDHLSVDPRFGGIGAFCSLIERAESLGLRVLVELVMQHTSDRHPWFQAARGDRNSPYRDYYIWADEPPDDGLKPIFPGVEDSVWTWDEVAGQYYRHRFYAHEPDLELGNPRVREEMYRIMAYWLRLGVHGFRIDAVPYMIERARKADPRDDGLWLLKDMRDFAWQRRPGAVLMGEADVPPGHYDDYFGDCDRLTHLLDFSTNNHLFLSAARGDARPLQRALRQAHQASGRGRLAVWLRNHDELDLEQLSERERAQVLEAFAPEESMRVYGRGIRRRLAPMMDGDPARLAMLHALLLSLPGTPVLRYGDEIGMGENLRLRERRAVRTPMQWHGGHNGGFSDAPAEALPVQPIGDGPYGYPVVNVQAQRWRHGSLLERVRGLVQTRVALREMLGQWRPVRHDSRRVFALRYDEPASGSAVFCFANLTAEALAVTVDEPDAGTLEDVACDGPYPAPTLAPLALRGYGYRWLRRVRP